MDSGIDQNQYLAPEGVREERGFLLKLTSLKNKKQFDLASKNSKFFVDDSLKVLSSVGSVILSDCHGILVGFKITKKISGSVGRNKLKRRIKSIFQNLLKLEKDYFYPGQTFIIIAKKPSIDKTYIELKTKISDCIRFLNKKLRKDH
jgi:ribonuclease P protein component